MPLFHVPLFYLALILIIVINLFTFTDQASVIGELISWINVVSISFLELSPDQFRMVMLTDGDSLKMGRVTLDLVKSPLFYSSHLSGNFSGCFYEESAAVDNDDDDDDLSPRASSKHVRLKYCNGDLSGLMFINGTMWSLHTESANNHIIFSNENLKPNHKNNGLLKSCPISEVALSTYHMNAFDTILAATGQINIDSGVERNRRSVSRDRYVEISIFHDSEYFKSFQSDRNLVNERAVELIHSADIYYSGISGLNLNLVLIDVQIWETKEEEPFNITSDAGKLLSKFLAWRYNSRNDLLPHDNGILISGIEFDGSTIGLAPVGTLCQETNSGSIVEYHTPNVGVLSGTIAHELGHNFKLNHNPNEVDDPCTCQTSQCVMNSGISSVPTNFTSCQQEKLKSLLSQGFGVCLNNRPSLVFGDPFCGDKFVNQDSEECDCGASAVCDDPCCNATTCKLVTGAVCSAQELCCDNSCQVRKEGSTCRAKVSPCDLPEYCDGKSSTCPKDVYIQNGETCSNSDQLRSHCFYGQCTTVYDQCSSLLEPEEDIDQETHASCWNTNERGDAMGNCGESTACSSADLRCGKLQCSSSTNKGLTLQNSNPAGSSSTVYKGDFSGFTCFSISQYKPTPDSVDDFSYVKDGTWCDDQSICVEKHCVNITNIPGLQICPQRCNGHGLCNSENHCHCNVGWAPPLCNVPGNGGSIDSGPASETPETSSRVVLIIFLVIAIIALISVVVFIFGRPIKFHLRSFYTKHFSTFPVESPSRSGNTESKSKAKYTPGTTSQGVKNSADAPEPLPRNKKPLPQASDFQITFDSVLAKPNNDSFGDPISVSYKPSSTITTSGSNGSRYPTTQPHNSGLPPPPPTSISLRHFSDVNN